MAKKAKLDKKTTANIVALMKNSGDARSILRSNRSSLGAASSKADLFSVLSEIMPQGKPESQSERTIKFLKARGIPIPAELQAWKKKHDDKMALKSVTVTTESSAGGLLSGIELRSVASAGSVKSEDKGSTV